MESGIGCIAPGTEVEVSYKVFRIPFGVWSMDKVEWYPNNGLVLSSVEQHDLNILNGFSTLETAPVWWDDA